MRPPARPKVRLASRAGADIPRRTARLAGYCFLLYAAAQSVNRLLEVCVNDGEGKYFCCVSSALTPNAVVRSRTRRLHAHPVLPSPARPTSLPLSP